jgi:hypothetical protein
LLLPITFASHAHYLEKKNFWDGCFGYTVFCEGESLRGSVSGNGVPVNHLSKENFLDSVAGKIDASPSPSCQAFVTLEKEWQSRVKIWTAYGFMMIMIWMYTFCFFGFRHRC